LYIKREGFIRVLRLGIVQCILALQTMSEESNHDSSSSDANQSSSHDSLEHTPKDQAESSIEGDDVVELTEEQKRKQTKLLQKRKREAEQWNKVQDDRGIIYISKIPPFMKPDKVRHLMAQYGEVDRLSLTPEGDQNSS
jgi:ESF2/ABP1 family protein